MKKVKPGQRVKARQKVKTAQRAKTTQKVKIGRRELLLRQMPKNSICAAIGVWKVGLTQRILNIVQPQKLHLIDPWLFQEEYPNRMYGGKVIQSQEDMDKIYQLVLEKTEGKNVVFHRDFSRNVVPNLEDNYLDWIYIDGNNSYEFVKQDLELCFNKVKVGGLIAGDDYNLREEESFPIRRAVNEFIGTGLVTVEAIHNNQFILKKE